VATLPGVRVEIGGEEVVVRLAWWQKLLGLMRDIHVPLRDVEGAEVVENAIGETARAGIKVGLRAPPFYYAARTIKLDEAFVVRRGRPALSIAIGGDGHLRRVLVSTPRAAELAEEIEARRR
jgi:hypothetical protein